MSELGDILRSAREKKHLTVDEVARATRIKATYLEALENGEYTVLPGPAYITGFLRNYASYIGIHPDDVVHEYYALRPPPQPSIKAATRVLANGHERRTRSRLFWALASVVMVLAAAYAIKQYNDVSAHSYTPPIYVTSATLGGPVAPRPAHRAPQVVHLRLHATAPVWVRITVDGRRVFQGLLHARDGARIWTAHRAVVIATFDGAHVRAVVNGRPIGLLARRPGLIIDEATPSSWQRIS